LAIRFAALATAGLSLLTTGNASAESTDRAAVQQVVDQITAKPVPFNGKFRIGSVSKTFVSTVVLQLAGEGRVDLDAPVDRYLPNLLPYRDITVRQVLQHTSGLFSFTKALPLDPAGFEQIRYRHWSTTRDLDSFVVALTSGKRLRLSATSAPTDGNPAYGAVIDTVFC
jgi:CubicO group peptidase (beta-lactamase class C family)